MRRWQCASSDDGGTVACRSSEQVQAMEARDGGQQVDINTFAQHSMGDWRKCRCG